MANGNLNELFHDIRNALNPLGLLKPKLVRETQSFGEIFCSSVSTVNIQLRSAELNRDSKKAIKTLRDSYVILNDQYRILLNRFPEASALPVIQRCLERYKSILDTLALRITERCSLKKIIGELVGARIEQSRNIRFIVDDDGNSDIALANYSDLERIFDNLIKNSVEAMLEEGGELHISIYETRQNIVVKLSDTGPGIPEHLKKRLFKKRLSKREGRGWGLLSVGNLVEKNDGFLNVESILGIGSSFVIFLPKG